MAKAFRGRIRQGPVVVLDSAVYYPLSRSILSWMHRSPGPDCRWKTWLGPGGCPGSAVGQESHVGYFDLPGRDAPSVRFTARCLSQLDPEVITGLKMRVGGRDPTGTAEEVDARLRRISCPVLLLQADPSAGASL